MRVVVHCRSASSEFVYLPLSMLHERRKPNIWLWQVPEDDLRQRREDLLQQLKIPLEYVLRAESPLDDLLR